MSCVSKTAPGGVAEQVPCQGLPRLPAPLSTAVLLPNLTHLPLPLLQTLSPPFPARQWGPVPFRAVGSAALAVVVAAALVAVFQPQGPAHPPRQVGNHPVVAAARTRFPLSLPRPNP